MSQSPTGTVQKYADLFLPVLKNMHRTNGKVIVNWVSPRVRGEIVGEDGPRLIGGVDHYAPAFSASPGSEDINPGQSVRFALTFNPKQSDRNYVSEIEAFVYFKNQVRVVICSILSLI